MINDIHTLNIFSAGVMFYCAAWLILLIYLYFRNDNNSKNTRP